MAEVKPNNQNQPKELSEPKKLEEPKRLQLPQMLGAMPTATHSETTKDESGPPSSTEITTKSAEAQQPGSAGYAVAEPLPNQNYSFKDKDLSAESADFNPVRPFGGLVGGGTGRALAQDESNKSNTDNGSSQQERAKRRFTENGSGGDSGGGSSSSSRSGGGGGSGEFDSLLGSLMGGSPAEAGKPSDVLSLSKFRPDANKSGPNIFDFASLRYNTAAQEGRIKRSAPKVAKTQLAKAP
ncbi:MAG: hypothetical protein HY537_00065 [Deltaproteobacteria bacterium]|nr:hypothetical protein [Deltaproteobacteria bacterium]